MWITRIAPVTIAASLLLLGPSAARAECTFQLFGNATATADGVVTARSIANRNPAYGGVAVEITPGITFAELLNLSTDYNLTDDGAAWGSPRFQIALDTNNDNVSDGNLFIYLGTPPNFDDAGTNTWVNTGNLIGSTDARFDYSQLVAGAQVRTYAQALADLGSAEILEIDLVADGGGAFADGEQTVQFENIQVNDCDSSADEDNDQVPDLLDRCPDSDTRQTVDIDGDLTTAVTSVPNVVDRNGCTVQDYINDLLDSNPRNHGQFVSAVTKIVNNFQRARLLSSSQASALKKAAAQSSVGKPTRGGGNGGGGNGVGNGGGNGNGNGHGNGHGNGNGNGNGRGNGGNGRGNGRR